MKKQILLPFAVLACMILLSLSVFAQSDCSILQVNNASVVSQTYTFSYWSSVMEFPFLLISVFFAFATARALRGGKFGKGMNLVAWGFVIMAVGHLHMQIEHFYGYNLFQTLLGQTGGTLAWFVALLLTWGFSGLGFYSILKASRGK